MNAIEIHDLCKNYGDFQLDHVSLTLPEGCVMGFIGENGAGKSTTINLILDLIRADSGEVLLYGQPNTRAFPALKEEIGVVLDEDGFPETLNLRDVNSIMRSAFRQWSEETFYGYVKRFGLPEKKKLKDYSKGMRMKLSLAVALSHGAKLLILDEATSGLDPVVRDEILDIFYDFTRDENHSILISSHIVSDLEKLCDYIAFMHKGKLILFEEKDELLNNYCIIQCTEDEINDFEKSSVLSIRKNEYGVSAVVKKSSVKGDVNLIPINLEDLFVYMIRGYER